jgi:hypothetical protein
MSLRNKLLSVIDAAEEGSIQQWRDFIGLDWKWALAYLIFIPFGVIVYVLGKLIGH